MSLLTPSLTDEARKEARQVFYRDCGHQPATTLTAALDGALRVVAQAAARAAGERIAAVIEASVPEPGPDWRHCHCAKCMAYRQMLADAALARKGGPP